MENSVCDAPARTLFPCPVGGMEALLLDDASEVASVERLIGLHGTVAVAAVVAPVTTPEPEIETILPGPGTASPLIVLDEFVIFPFDRTVPLFVGPLAAMPAESMVPPPEIVTSPHEKTACEASEPGTVNGSVPAARHAGANAATRTLESARIRRGFLILIVIIFSGWTDSVAGPAASRRFFS
jgi:hypothetical protein